MLALLGELGSGGATWADDAAEVLRALLKENETLRGLVQQMGLTRSAPPAPMTFRTRVQAAAGTATTDAPRCPRCRGDMVLRTNRADGTRFWGCQRYPQCRGTVDSYVGGAMRRRAYDAQTVEAWCADHNLDDDEERQDDGTREDTDH